METYLCKLAFKYGTDKCPQIRHNYTPEYFRMFKNLKPKKVLELGIGTVQSMKHVDGYLPGASHRMWRDFFPTAQIYGVDIAKECMFEDERIKTFLLDTTKPADVEWLIKEIGSDLDIVIDDGPHQTRHQIRTARHLLPLLDKGVIYIIEDSKNPDTIKENLPEYDVEVLKLEGVRDDNLVIVRK